MKDYVLILKSPNLKIDVEEINCPTTWLVRDLKNFFNVTFEDCPSFESQRLIYGGKLMKDTELLSSHFREDKKTVENNKEELNKNETEELQREYFKYLSDFYSSDQNCYWQNAYYSHMMQYQTQMMKAYTDSLSNAGENAQTTVPEARPVARNRLGILGFLNRAIRNVWEQHPVQADENDLMMVVEDDGRAFVLFNRYRRNRNLNQANVNRVVNILQQVNEPNQPREETNDADADTTDAVENETAETAQSTTETPEQQVVAVSFLDRMRSGASIMWTFVYTLIVSLVPDQVPDEL